MFRRGDRVVVKDPGEGKPFHTFDGREYDHETWVGRVGTVTKTGEGSVSVTWDYNKNSGRPTSCIDLPCLGFYDDPDDDEIASLFGISPPKHCSTCRCSPMERARNP